MSEIIKKPVTILVTFISVIITSIKVPYLITPVTKNSSKTLATNKLTIAFKTLILSINSCLTLEDTKVLLLLKYVFWIYYLIQFKKDWETKIYSLIDSNSKINAIILAYTKKQGL